jgi:predicted alpha/beta-fold hydrolase
VLTAQDDPFVPFASFLDPAVARNPAISLIAPEQGGHCAFISRRAGDNRFWAEARVMEFFSKLRAASVNQEEIGEAHRK